MCSAVVKSGIRLYLCEKQRANSRISCRSGESVEVTGRMSGRAMRKLPRHVGTMYSSF